MYVVHPNWLRPRNRGVLINCEGFTQVDVSSSLEVLFLHLGVVSVTGGDAQGVPQVAELGDLLKDVTDKSSGCIGTCAVTLVSTCFLVSFSLALSVPQADAVSSLEA
ncbi:hypothetical protein ACFX14_026301 [Malus domestica]